MLLRFLSLLIRRVEPVFCGRAGKHFSRFRVRPKSTRPHQVLLERFLLGTRSLRSWNVSSNERHPNGLADQTVIEARLRKTTRNTNANRKKYIFGVNGWNKSSMRSNEAHVRNTPAVYFAACEANVAGEQGKNKHKIINLKQIQPLADFEYL